MKRIALVALALLFVTSVAHAQTTCTLTFQTESIGEFTVGQPAHFDIEAVSGTPPYTFEVVEGAFPEGLHMNPKGKIRGNPKEVADTTVFIQLSDSAGCTITQAFVVRVNP